MKSWIKPWATSYRLLVFGVSCCNLTRMMTSDVYVCGPVCSGDDVHVSHSGSDIPRCGPTAQPCATVRYALYHHSNASYIHVDGSGGPYTAEADTQYLLVNHSVTLMGTGLRPAVIQCTDNNRTKLFHFSSASPPHHIKVRIEVTSLSVCLSVSYNTVNPRSKRGFTQWCCLSVCLFVCLFLCHLFFLM